MADKRRRVQEMFAAIAPSYDLNNRLHSLWRDQAWRKKAVTLAKIQPNDRIVDVACGTGDLTLKFFGMLWFERIRAASGPKSSDDDFWALPAQVVGIDFTFDMLPLARRKG